jgi:hypothetical protein
MIHKLLEIAQNEVGVRESGGNNKGKRIREYQASTDLAPAAWPWCFDESVETLTISGWKKLSDIQKNDIVAQVDSESKSVSFVNPTAIIHTKNKISISTIKSRSLNFKCDARHKFWGYWNTTKYENSPQLKPISSLTSSLTIPSIKINNDDNIKFSFLDLDFIAAFIADGYFARKKREHQKIRIQVSKERKIQELKKFGGQEHKSQKVYGSSKSPLTTFEFQIPDYFEVIFSDYKEIRWDWAFSLSSKQAEYFIDRYVFWDGTIKTKVISTARKQNADVFAAMSILCGKHPNLRTRKFEKKKPCYEITTSNKKTRTLKKEHISINEEEIDLYCISVPSEIIICRDSGGTPFVTGNCAAFVDWCIKEWLNNPQAIRWLNLKKSTPESWRPKTALAYGLTKWAKNKPNTTKIFTEKDVAMPGDIVTFDFSHVGIVISDDGSSIQVVEGNTNGRGDRDSTSGDGVWKKIRKKSLVKDLIRIHPSIASI